jgi:hypothetical protein
MFTAPLFKNAQLYVNPFFMFFLCVCVCVCVGMQQCWKLGSKLKHSWLIIMKLQEAIMMLVLYFVSSVKSYLYVIKMGNNF